MKRVQTESKAGPEFGRLQEEMSAELDEIVSWWSAHAPNREGEGFYGSIGADDAPDASAAHGIVYYSRILWTFSAAARFTSKEVCSELAGRAYECITKYFADKEYGGVFWSVDAAGNMLDGKKQVYGIAFCMYGLSEYYKLTGKEEVLTLARALFQCLEQYSYDKVSGGYVEAFTRDWQPAVDVRLSDKDENESKTMNTHLHVIEAYANLYSVWKDEDLRARIVHLLELFEKYFIDKQAFHLKLFFDDEWRSRSSLISFGHDIEAAWLLQQCAETAVHEEYIEIFKEFAVKIATAATEGLDKDGGLWYEADPAKGFFVREKHWWCQAEAIVGFVNAWQVTGEQHFLDKANACWRFVNHYIKDTRHGEWFWGVNADGTILAKEKAGFWKCPYHNGRACMEIMTRNSFME